MGSPSTFHCSMGPITIANVTLFHFSRRGKEKPTDSSEFTEEFLQNCDSVWFSPSLSLTNRMRFNSYTFRGDNCLERRSPAEKSGYLIYNCHRAPHTSKRNYFSWSRFLLHSSVSHLHATEYTIVYRIRREPCVAQWVYYYYYSLFFVNSVSLIAWLVYGAAYHYNLQP